MLELHDAIFRKYRNVSCHIWTSILHCELVNLFRQHFHNPCVMGSIDVGDFIS